MCVSFDDAAIRKVYIASVVGEWNMSMEHSWTDTDRYKQKYSEKNLSPCHFIKMQIYLYI
jgi:hypothetical protein